MNDPKTILARAQLPEQVVSLCMSSDHQNEFEAAERELRDAEKAAADREASGADSLAGADTTGLTELADRIEALRDEMAAFTLDLRLRALPRRTYSALLAAHPVREGVARDAEFGFNFDTFSTALVRASVVAPALDDDDWTRLDEVLNEGQWDHLTAAAFTLNRRQVSVPFSPAASRIRATYAHASKRPTPSE